MHRYRYCNRYRSTLIAQSISSTDSIEIEGKIDEIAYKVHREGESRGVVDRLWIEHVVWTRRIIRVVDGVVEFTIGIG